MSNARGMAGGGGGMLKLRFDRYIILEMVILLKIKREAFFKDSIPILASRTVKTRKFKLLYFRNEICYGNANL